MEGKERNTKMFLKSQGWKWENITFRETIIRMMAGVSSKIMETKTQQKDIFEMLKEQ